MVIYKVLPLSVLEIVKPIDLKNFNAFMLYLPSVYVAPDSSLKGSFMSSKTMFNCVAP